MNGEVLVNPFKDEIINDYPEIPVRKQLNHGYSDWICSHKAPFPSIEAFLASIK